MLIEGGEGETRHYTRHWPPCQHPTHCVLHVILSYTHILLWWIRGGMLRMDMPCVVCALAVFV